MCVCDKFGWERCHGQGMCILFIYSCRYISIFLAQMLVRSRYYCAACRLAGSWSFFNYLLVLSLAGAIRSLASQFIIVIPVGNASIV